MLPQNPELAHAFALASAGKGDDARAIVERLAEARDPEALYTLADMHTKGMLVPQNGRRGRELFAAAADAGNVEAGYIGTNLLASGISGPRDWPGAIARLRSEAKEHSHRAQVLALVEAMDLDDNGDPRMMPEPQQLAESPWLAVYRGLFTPQECAFLCDLAVPRLAPSLVSDDRLGQVRDPIRTSDSATIVPLIEDPATHALNRRLAAASGSSYEQGEMLLVLRYAPGQEYRPHLDALPGLANQRIRTALVYLNAGYAGGETGFPRINRVYRGGIGNCIVFRNTTADGRADPMSVHAGLPVKQGTKFLASRWIRARSVYDADGPRSD